MKISNTMAALVLIGACISTWLLTQLKDPTLHQLRQHGVHVSERATAGGGSTLTFLVEANNTFVSMAFPLSSNTPTAYQVADWKSNVVRVGDDDQDGHLDRLTLTYVNDGLDYLYADPNLRGDYTQKMKVKGNDVVENMLKIEGKWVHSKHVGPNVVATIDGKEMFVDPSKSPIAILGPAPTSPVAEPGKSN